jgi:hypothetical protein
MRPRHDLLARPTFCHHQQETWLVGQYSARRSKMPSKRGSAGPPPYVRNTYYVDHGPGGVDLPYRRRKKVPYLHPKLPLRPAHEFAERGKLAAKSKTVLNRAKPCSTRVLARSGRMSRRAHLEVPRVGHRRHDAPHGADATCCARPVRRVQRRRSPTTPAACCSIR